MRASMQIKGKKISASTKGAASFHGIYAVTAEGDRIPINSKHQLMFLRRMQVSYEDAEGRVIRHSEVYHTLVRATGYWC